MRVLVCRALADGLRTAGRLAEAGHEAILAPVLEIVPRTADLPEELSGAVVVTSAQALASLSKHQIERLSRLPLFAVGPATGDAARGHGFGDIHVAGGDARALASEIDAYLPQAAPLLYLAGAVRKPALEDSVRASGRPLRVVETYEARPAPSWPPAIVASVKAAGLHAALHYSARSAALTFAYAEQAGVHETVMALRHVCVSAAVADVIRRMGGGRVESVEPGDEPALIGALGRAGAPDA